MSGRVYVVSGPSGVGKSTIIREVRKRMDKLEFSVSHTTRKPRGKEKDGVEYHFTSVDAFRDMIDRGEFTEWAIVYGDYYGTSFAQLREMTSRGLDVVMDLDVQGAVNMRQSMKESCLVFVLPPSMEVLRRRLLERATEDRAAVIKRIDKAEREIGNCARYDYLIVNDNLEVAVDEMMSIIKAERCQTPRRFSDVSCLLQVADESERS
jgi:guanylate kinase